MILVSEIIEVQFYFSGLAMNMVSETLGGFYFYVLVMIMVSETIEGQFKFSGLVRIFVSEIQDNSISLVWR